MDDLTRMRVTQGLRRAEQLRLKMYEDSRGVLTIGWGHNLRDVPISSAAAEQIFQDDLQAAELELRRRLPWTDDLDPARYGALLDMAFNMGVQGLLGFHKTLAAIQAGDYDLAEVEMLDSDWAKQVGDRATRLAAQMRTGEWQQ